MGGGGKGGVCRLKGKWWLQYMSIYCVRGTLPNISHVCWSHLDMNMELAAIVNPFCR